MRFGPFEIRDLIGHGGMGEVYRALDPRLGREVAIKVLSPHLADDAHSPPALTGVEPAVVTLIHAREAWAGGDTATASRLLDQSRAEGIDTTWFSEEAVLLASDLGAPARPFRPDPPYPNRLRFIAVWELGRVAPASRRP